MYFLLLYEVVDDYLERRARCATSISRSPEPRTSAVSSLLAGAFAEPADGAALVFRADDASTVEAFVQRRPLRAEGTRHVVDDPAVDRRDRRRRRT